MSDRIEITPVTGPLEGHIRPPGSKSITNRALVCAALAQGETLLTGVLESEDTRVMIDAIKALKIPVEHDPAAATARVGGCAGRIPASEGELYVANSGTTVRFLTAMLSLASGRFRLTGTPRMHERPIKDLLDALTQLGIDAESEQKNGCPPVVINAHALQGGSARIRGDISSQFLSALMMAAPYARAPVELVVEGKLVSVPYIEMTAAVMEAFGVAIDLSNLKRIQIPQGTYAARQYAIEPDASAASYFFAAAAICGGTVTVEGLSEKSLQGDVQFCRKLEKMGVTVSYTADSITVTGGALKGIDTDMNAISDTVQTLAAVALFARGTTRIRNVAHIRHKETDRIGDLARELRRLGARVDEHADGLEITPGDLHGAEIHTYNDHRMAMSLALVGLRVKGVLILDPRCTEKTYPNFFQDLERVTSVASK